jgi:hypothetical protein
VCASPVRRLSRLSADYSLSPFVSSPSSPLSFASRLTSHPIQQKPLSTPDSAHLRTMPVPPLPLELVALIVDELALSCGEDDQTKRSNGRNVALVSVAATR